MSSQSPTSSPSDTSQAILGHEDLRQVFDAAKGRLSLLCEEFPNLKAYLVFAYAGQQAGIGSSPNSIIKDIPAMVIDDAAARSMRKHLKEKPGEESKKSTQDAWQDKLKPLGQRLHYHGQIQIELRFSQLDFEVIEQLQCHPQIDQDRTPQARASIRIVLCTIEELIK